MDSPNNRAIEDSSTEMALSSLVPVQTTAQLISRQAMSQSYVPMNELEEAPVDFSRFLHALRRNWLLGLMLGLLLAAPLAAAPWLLIPKQYTATELIRVSSNQVPLVFETAESAVKFDYRSYKNTQRQLLLQPLVLNKALQDEKVSALPAVQELEDPVGWLKKKIIVTFPDEAEIMTVSLKANDPVVAYNIVNAVVNTYMRDVVEKERAERQNRIQRLEKILEDAEVKVRKKRSELRALVDLLGTSDSSTLNIAQQATLQQLSLLRTEISKTDFELRRAQGEFQALTGRPYAVDWKSPVANATTEEAADESQKDSDTNSPTNLDPAMQLADAKSEISEPETPDDKAHLDDPLFLEMLEHDPAAIKHTNEVDRLKTLIAKTTERYNAERAKPYLTKYQKQLEEAEKKLEERTLRVEQLFLAKQPKKPAINLSLDANSNGRNQSNTLATQRAEFLAAQKTEAQKAEALAAQKADVLAVQIGILEKQREELVNERKALDIEANKFGRSSIDTEMLRKEIDGYEPVVGKVSQEIERTKIELQSNSRIVRYESSGVPQVGEAKMRIPATAAAGLLGLFGPLILLVLRDSRKNHVNGMATMSNNAGMPVLGSIPRVPRHVVRRINDTSNKSTKKWRERLSESISEVTAMLLRKLSIEGHRVVMVSSAMPGEGKSTLAEQLGRSLAASGHRTLLVDFDLRRPTLHRRFNVPQGPGVCEVLRQGSNLSATVRQTSTPNLDLLTAGNHPGSLLFDASNQVLENFFKECRAEYELILVDSSPLLPIVDGRLVGQHTDGAIFTVVKDVSQINQVMDARQIMLDYGIPILGCVVTGDDKGRYYRHYNEVEQNEGQIARGITASRSMSAM